MNVFRRLVVFVHVRALGLLLVIAIILLIGQLCWPAAVRWCRLPSPGKTGFDCFQADTLASEFAIQLLQPYHNGQCWPLVVFLHGAGKRANDPNTLRGRGLFPQKLPAIVAGPQCLPSRIWQPDAVADLVEYVASQYYVDRLRIYLVGYSMGGYATWETAARYPELFAAIVPIAGSGEPNVAQALAGVPIWAFHGEKDKAVPAVESERVLGRSALSAGSRD